VGYGLIRDELLETTKKAGVVVEDQMFDEFHLLAGIRKNHTWIRGFTAENIGGEYKRKIGGVHFSFSHDVLVTKSLEEGN
jgi:hypothetical protein